MMVVDGRQRPGFCYNENMYFNPILLSLLGYFSLLMIFWIQAKREQNLRLKPWHWVLIAALTAVHSVVLIQQMWSAEGIYLGLSNMLILVGFIVFILSLILTYLNNNASVLLMLCLLNCLLILFGLFSPDSNTEAFDVAFSTHAILSVTAYSIIGLTAVHALITLLLEHILHTKKSLRLIYYLPALGQMDRWLIILLWSSFISLTIALFSGFVVLDDMFTQKVSHKTILSIVSWLVFATLLVLRNFKGWQSKQLSVGVMLGSFLLMLGFIGSKFVIERLLN